MNKSKRDAKLKKILPVLVVVAVFVWGQNLKQTGIQRRDGLSEDQADQDNAKLLGIVARDVPQILVKKSHYKDWGRNPFVLEEDLTNSESTGIEYVSEAFDSQNQDREDYADLQEEVIHPRDVLVLNGIFWNENKPTALINNKVFGVGRSVEGFVIVDIKRDQLIVSNGQESFVLSLH